MSTVSSVSSTPAPGTTSTTGVGSLTSSDFLNLMLKQLEQQDPLNPTDSNQLLTQISQISTLQSNTAMAQNIQGLTLQQSIGAAGNLIGKSIQGIDPTGTQVQGTVIGVTVANQAVSLSLDSGSTLPMSNVTTIQAAANGSSSSLTALAQLGQLLQGGSSSTSSLASLLASNPNLGALVGGVGTSNSNGALSILQALGAK